jgi:hypothetical protein
MANNYLRVAILCIIMTLLLYTSGLNNRTLDNANDEVLNDEPYIVPEPNPIDEFSDQLESPKIDKPSDTEVEDNEPEEEDPEPKEYIEFQTPLSIESNFTVINTQMEGTNPVVDEDIIVFSTDGNYGTPRYVYYHNVTLNSTVNTSVQGQNIGLDVPYIVISNLYNASFYNVYTGKNTQFAENARVSWPCIDNGKIVYVVLEMDDGIDHNKDGDTHDYCGYLYDIETGVSTYIAVGNSIHIDGDYIAGGFNNYLWYYEISTGTLHELGLETRYPDLTVTSWSHKLDDKVFGFRVQERENDFNGNGKTYDFFSAYYDISKGKLKIITEMVPNYYVDISARKIFLETYNMTSYSSEYCIYYVDNESLVPLQNFHGYWPNMEEDLIASVDWNGDGIPEDPPPVGVPNILLYDTMTKRHVNTSVIGSLHYWQGEFSGDIIAFITSEYSIEQDLNNDGDLWDGIIRYIMDVKM